MKLSISSSTDEEAGIEVKICGEGQGGAAAGASGVQGQGQIQGTTLNKSKMRGEKKELFRLGTLSAATKEKSRSKDNRFKFKPFFHQQRRLVICSVGGVLLIAVVFVISKAVLESNRSVTVVSRKNTTSNSTEESMLIVSKSNKANKTDDSCLADVFALPLKDSCSSNEEVSTVEVTYEYNIINNDEEDVQEITKIVACNEVKLHRELVQSSRKFCPRDNEEPKGQSRKKGVGKDSIVVSISSSPDDEMLPCPDTKAVDKDETCQVSGGLTLMLNFASANDTQAKQNALKNVLKILMKKMNSVLELGLRKKEMSRDKKTSEEFVENLSLDELGKLMSGEHKLQVSFSVGSFSFTTFEATVAPSDSPSMSELPTSQPSDNPSSSILPTSQPSTGPSTSALPSIHPSDTPTDSGSPSLIPSKSPSDLPTTQPSDNPSSSILPTSQPSDNPSSSILPTSQPSDNPSSSILPTTRPSDNPSSSILPSSQPSDNPSSSILPTSQPSDNPSSSILPTSQPSDNPSSSIFPTSQPSDNPSSSILPTSQPSDNPSSSILPTSQPSDNPSSSILPTSQPSDNPSSSILPTSQPSDNPSSSILPTSQPSDNPSSSILPTSQPSTGPSTSALPSINPSDTPTDSGSPSLIPSTSPSDLPTSQPSDNPTPDPCANFNCLENDPPKSPKVPDCVSTLFPPPICRVDNEGNPFCTYIPINGGLPCTYQVEGVSIPGTCDGQGECINKCDTIQCDSPPKDYECNNELTCDENDVTCSKANPDDIGTCNRVTEKCEYEVKGNLDPCYVASAASELRYCWGGRCKSPCDTYQCIDPPDCQINPGVCENTSVIDGDGRVDTRYRCKYPPKPLCELEFGVAYMCDGKGRRVSGICTLCQHLCDGRDCPTNVRCPDGSIPYETEYWKNNPGNCSDTCADGCCFSQCYSPCCSTNPNSFRCDKSC